MGTCRTTNESLVGVGIYTPAEAHRLTGVPYETIRRWMRGEKKRGSKTWLPAKLRSQLPLIDSQMALGFLDLLEVRIIHQFRKAGLPWKALEAARNVARRKTKSDHPFSTMRFRTDGKSVFDIDGVSESDRRGASEVVEVVGNQRYFNGIILPCFKGLEFEDEIQPVRWRHPLGGDLVVLDPQRNFGSPIIERLAIPTERIAKAYRANDGDLGELAFWWQVEESEVVAAVEFESGIRKAAA